ncbi:MAG: hypothetical protein QW812_01415 [Thermoplasmataceae archaeon]
MPEGLRKSLSCGNVSDLDRVIILNSVDIEGFPHYALLSPFQIVADGDSALLIAVYSGSTTVENIMRTGKAALAIFMGGGSYYIKGEVTTAGIVQHGYNGAEEKVFRMSSLRVLHDKSEIAPVITDPRFLVNGVVERYSATRRHLCSMALQR